MEKVFIQLFSVQSLLLFTIIGQIGLFNFCMITSLGEGKLWIQTSLKNWPEGLDKYILRTGTFAQLWHGKT